MDDDAGKVGDIWFDHLFTSSLPGGYRTKGVLLHQVGVASDIGSQYGRKFGLDGVISDVLPRGRSYWTLF